MTVDELYDKLMTFPKETQWEVVEVFRSVRYVRFVVEEQEEANGTG
jgi:hypothetical protein